MMGMLIILNTVPLAASAEITENLPQVLDPTEILSRISGKAADIAPQIPDPLKGIYLQIPQPISGGTANMPSATAPLARADPTSINASDDGLVHPVDLETGKLNLTSTDMQVQGIGFDFMLIRTYDPDLAQAGAFGKAWDFNWNSQLQMYAEYAMGETRADGTTNSYTFVKDDPNAYVFSYDGDQNTNYDLNKGHYLKLNGDQLQRNSQFDYFVTTRSGIKYTYYGYYAPWRTGQDSKAGKLFRMQDRFGNAITIDYNDEGRPIQITDTVGRIIKLTWNNGLISSATDPSGAVYTYSYDASQRLIQVKSPQGRTTGYQYDDHNRITEVVNGEQGTTSFNYNNNNQVTAVKDSFGVTQLTFTYQNGKTEMRDVSDHLWEYGIADKKVTSIDDPAENH